MVPGEIKSYIDGLRDRRAELEARLADPGIYAHNDEFRRVSQEHRKLEELFSNFEAWEKALGEIADNHELLSGESDAELRELIENDIATLSQRAAELEERIQLSLLPPDPNDSKNIIQIFMPRIVTRIDKYLGKSCASCACLKNLNPESPTQSEKIIQRKDKNAIDKEYKPYCSGGKRLV